MIRDLRVQISVLAATKYLVKSNHCKLGQGCPEVVVFIRAHKCRQDLNINHELYSKVIGMIYFVMQKLVQYVT